MRPSGKYIAILLAIGWFLGALSGFAIFHFCHGPAMHGRHRMRHRLYRELKLTPEQRQRADAIIDASHQQLEKIFAETRPRVEGVRLSTRDQLRALLTPDQQAKFDRLGPRIEHHFKKRFESLPD